MSTQRIDALISAKGEMIEYRQSFLFPPSSLSSCCTGEGTNPVVCFPNSRVEWVYDYQGMVIGMCIHVWWM